MRTNQFLLRQYFSEEDSAASIWYCNEPEAMSVMQTFFSDRACFFSRVETVTENPNGRAGPEGSVSVLHRSYCKGTNEVAGDSKHLVTQDLSYEVSDNFEKQNHSM